jgi:hypothetical protein
MADKAGPIVSKAFYNYMFRNPGNKADIRDSAKALSVAIRELRKQGAPLDCWIVLVHIGCIVQITLYVRLGFAILYKFCINTSRH